MKGQEIKETLETQLQLLSERSMERGIGVQELVALTNAMNETVSYLLSISSRVV